MEHRLILVSDKRETRQSEMRFNGSALARMVTEILRGEGNTQIAQVLQSPMARSLVAAITTEPSSPDSRLKMT